MDAHFAAYFQIQYLRCSCARRILASGQKWQKGSGVALTTDPRDTFNLGLSASWEIDVWNSILNGRNAAALYAVSQELLFESARLSIAARVTDTWLVANGNYELLGIAREEVAARQRTVSDISARVAERSALAIDENRARAKLAVAR